MTVKKIEDASNVKVITWLKIVNYLIAAEVVVRKTILGLFFSFLIVLISTGEEGHKSSECSGAKTHVIETADGEKREVYIPSETNDNGNNVLILLHWGRLNLIFLVTCKLQTLGSPGCSRFLYAVFGYLVFFFTFHLFRHRRPSLTRQFYKISAIVTDPITAAIISHSSLNFKRPK